MALLKQWRDKAYDEKANKGDIQRFWANYFNIEKEIYEQLLEDPDTEVKGTVKELAEKYGQDVMTMTGFLDGINDSLVEPNPIEEMEEDTVVSLKFGQGEALQEHGGRQGGLAVRPAPVGQDLLKREAERTVCGAEKVWHDRQRP